MATRKESKARRAEMKVVGLRRDGGAVRDGYGPREPVEGGQLGRHD
jgi:hypothetical protein